MADRWKDLRNHGDDLRKCKETRWGGREGERERERERERGEAYLSALKREDQDEEED